MNVGLNEGAVSNVFASPRKTYGLPGWFMPTYNIMTQLSEVVGDYLNVSILNFLHRASLYSCYNGFCSLKKTKKPTSGSSNHGTWLVD